LSVIQTLASIQGYSCNIAFEVHQSDNTVQFYIETTSREDQHTAWVLSVVP